MARRGRPSIFGRLDEEEDTEQSKLSWLPSPSPQMQRRPMQRSNSCNLRSSLCLSKPATEGPSSPENSPSLNAEDGDDGSVASRLLGAIGKSISSPSLTSCCKEVARETPYQKSLKLSKMKLHHCTEELGSESCTSSYNPNFPAPVPPLPLPLPFTSSSPLSVGEEENPASSPSPSPRPTLFRRRSFLTLVNGYLAIARDQPPVLSPTKTSNFPPPIDSLPPSPASSCSSANAHDEAENGDGDDDGQFLVTLRSCKQDGRFVLKEAKVPIPSPCLRASRSGSRLTLCLNAPLAPSATPSFAHDPPSARQAMAADPQRHGSAQFSPNAPLVIPEPHWSSQLSPTDPSFNRQPRCLTQLNSNASLMSPQMSLSDPWTSPQCHCPSQLSSFTSLMSPQPSSKHQLMSPQPHCSTELSLSASLLSPEPPHLSSKESSQTTVTTQLSSNDPLMSPQPTRLSLNDSLWSPQLLTQQSNPNGSVLSPQQALQQPSPNDPSMRSRSTQQSSPNGPIMSTTVSKEGLRVDDRLPDPDGMASQRGIVRAAAISPVKMEVVSMFTPAPEAKVVESFLPETSRKSLAGDAEADVADLLGSPAIVESSDGGHEKLLGSTKGALDNAAVNPRLRSSRASATLEAPERGGISGTDHGLSGQGEENSLEVPAKGGGNRELRWEDSGIRGPNYGLRCAQPILGISKGPTHHYHHHHHLYRQPYPKRVDWLHGRHRKDQLECRNELRKASMKIRCVATTS